MSAKSRAVAGPPRTQQHGGMHRQPPRTIAEKVAPAALGGRKLAVAGLIGSAALASPGVAAWASSPTMNTAEQQTASRPRRRRRLSSGRADHGGICTAMNSGSRTPSARPEPTRFIWSPSIPAARHFIPVGLPSTCAR
jgi:hypothetical protein